jgi:lysine/ornithine N-monooxygenase
MAAAWIRDNSVSGETVDVAIIGAGPYGLSVAAHVAARNIEYRIFGSPMSTWNECMPEGMLLRSEAFASNLSDPAGEYTLARFGQERQISVGKWRDPTPLDVYREYAQWFIGRLALPVENSWLEHVSRVDDGFEMRFADAPPVTAKRLIVAIGLTHFSRSPEQLATLPNHLWSHSSAPLKYQDFIGHAVTVVGAGQSALETAALLCEHGVEARVVARASTVNWHVAPLALDRPVTERLRRPVGGLGIGWKCVLAEQLPTVFRRLPVGQRLDLVDRTFGPAGAWWLRDRVEGRVPVLLGRSIHGAHPKRAGVELQMSGPEGEERVFTEHVVAATGYRVDIARLEFLDERLRQTLRTVGTSPWLSSGFESSVPGLHFVGVASAATFGPLMRFVLGAEFAARRVVRRLAAGQR